MLLHHLYIRLQARVLPAQLCGFSFCRLIFWKCVQFIQELSYAWDTPWVELFYSLRIYRDAGTAWGIE